jgi:hypothetical protein
MTDMIQQDRGLWRMWQSSQEEKKTFKKNYKNEWGILE